jgi:hypothetical protein
MNENKIDVEQLLKNIKKNTKYVELTEKYLDDLKKFDCSDFTSYLFAKDFNDRKKYNEQLKKRLICDHEKNPNCKYFYELSNNENYWNFFDKKERIAITGKFFRKKTNEIIYKNITIKRYLKVERNN